MGKRNLKQLKKKKRDSNNPAYGFGTICHQFLFIIISRKFSNSIHGAEDRRIIFQKTQKRNGVSSSSSIHQKIPFSLGVHPIHLTPRTYRIYLTRKRNNQTWKITVFGNQQPHLHKRNPRLWLLHLLLRPNHP